MPRESSVQERERFVFCLSMDMIDSTQKGLEFTRKQRNRFNVRLVEQIRPHLEKLGLNESLVKFTGDGWLLVVDDAVYVLDLCYLAIIMAHRFKEEISNGTGISADRIPSLRLAIHSGFDVSVKLPDGRRDWVGDSVRKAVRASTICNPDEVLIGEPVREIAQQEFHINHVNIEERCKPKKWEEDIEPLFTLGDLKDGVAEDSETSENIVYMLGQIGRKTEAETLHREVSEYLESKAIKLAPDEIEARGEILKKWNRVMASAPNYPSVLDTLRKIQKTGYAPDIFTYSILINKAPSYEEAKEWMKIMKERKIQPNVVTYNTLIKKASDLGEVRALMDMMRKEGVKPDVFTYNTLILKASDYRDARNYEYEMREMGVKPDVFTYSELIDKAPDYSEAEAVLKMMQKDHVQPNVVTYSGLIDKAPDYSEAEALLKMMKKDGVQPNIFTYNTLIKKAPELSKAKTVVDTMRDDGIQPNVVTYSGLIDKALYYREAVTLFKTMKKDGVQPNIFTYNTLIKKAPDLKEAKSLRDSMQEVGIPPDIYTYNILIKKAPDFAEAKALIDRMQIENIQPSVFTYTTLFSKDLSDVMADDILDWYSGQKYHPPQPIEAAIVSYRKTHLDQALRLTLGYPHLSAAIKLIRDYDEEALSYFRSILDQNPQHPNANYALGIALMELGKESEAVPYLKKAHELATAIRRKEDIEHRLRRMEKSVTG